MVANCKHFAGYDLDDWAVTGINRYHFDAQITIQELAEYHMPPFRSCVRDAQAGSVMCSTFSATVARSAFSCNFCTGYNSVNGVPSCANPYLLQVSFTFRYSSQKVTLVRLQDILRDTWDFGDGWVTYVW